MKTHFVMMHEKDGRSIYIAPEHVEVIKRTHDGGAEIDTSDGYYALSETPEEVLRIIEGVQSGGSSTDSQYIPLVEAVRRLIAYLDESKVVSAFAPVVRDLRSMLAAMEER
jgi:hypothetical protein